MRVAIDATYAARAPRSGTAVYVERLSAALELTGEVEVVRIVNERRRPRAGGGIGSARNALADEWWASIELPRRARAAGATLIHHPLPARSYGCALPQIITIHDLAFERCPEDFAPAYRRYAHVAHRAAARMAAAVIAVSGTTAGDLAELWGVSGARVVVAPHGPGQFAESPVEAGEAAASRPSEHLLYVGDDEPRKDLRTLRAAHERYRAAGGRLPLVVAGPAGVPVSRERLRGLYAGAAALVHPSRYEGFGLTVLEAMACGVPVIAAACPAVVELVDGAARLYPPGDADALTTALLEADGLGALAAAGRRRAADFSWARSARRHLDAYSLAVGV